MLSINENKNKMDLGLFKIGRYVDSGLFKTKDVICLFVSVKCGKEGKKLQKFECLESKKSFLDEIKST